MGTRLIQQRRGKGSPSYKRPSFRFVGEISYPSIQDKVICGEVMDLIDCPGHFAPLAFIQFEDGQTGLIPAVQGLKVGGTLETGPGAKSTLGSIVMLRDIPSSEVICAIERTPGGDVKLVRTAGSAASIMDKEGEKVTVKLPSRKKIILNGRCRALIGKIAGGGRKDKPMLKAGINFHARGAKNQLYPRTHGVAMNACSHPFGGTHRRTKGRSKSVSRNAPPGRKVGSIASRRTGMQKK